MTLAELVEDSEGEEYLFRPKDLLQPPRAANPPQSDPPLKTVIMANNAVASTSRGEPRAEPEVATKKPRPKPRRKLPTGSIQAAPFAPPSDLSSTITSAPRNVPTTVPLESILPVDLGPQDIPLTIADRAKSRVRNAKSKPVVQDIIDIPSDEDDRLLQLSPYRPKQKDVHRAKTRPIPDLPPPSIHPSQESLVTPTSDFQPAPAISSQLPPSDPPSSMLPLPTSTPESAKKRRQAVDAGDAEESPLNPSKKWKRRRVDLGDDENNQTRVSPPQATATDGQPPNFFASSSSSLPPPPAPLVRGESRKEKLVNRNQLNDGVSPPRAIDSGRRREKKSRSKPKKKFPVQPEPNEVGNPPPISAPTSRSRLNAEAAGDTDEEAGLLVLPPPSRQLEPQSPLSDLSDASSRASKPVTPSSNRERLVPEVVITTVPRKRTSSPQIQAAKEGRSIGEDRTGESAKGRKRRKKVVEEDYFDGLDDQVEVTPKKGSKGKGKALPRGKSRTKPQPKEVVVDEESEGDRFDDVTKVSKKVKTKVKAKATTKAKSIRSRVVDSDDEVTADSTMKNSGLGAAPADDDRTGDSSIAVHQNEIALPQDTRDGQENTPPPPNPEPNPNVTPSSVSRKTPAPTPASSFARLNYGHSLANEEKAMTMTEIIKKANSATGTPSGIRSHSSFMKGSRSVLRKIAPLHTRRKTPPPLPPKPPPPKKTKKQLELEEKWEEELEETIEGWVALSSQERELLRKQKRDMEMGCED